MKTHALILAATGVSLIAFTGLVRADDHLFQAQQHGLTAGSQPFQTNKAGHSGTLAPGQGSPFTGADTQTPATDTQAANDHANVKARQPK
ncbi:MAG: hypothetical protein E5W82_27960 [Mesorhizobium sp.]|nr:MAG: hypothetical protein E5W82_27960 [Mesorhizobium sp.]